MEMEDRNCWRNDGNWLILSWQCQLRKKSVIHPKWNPQAQYPTTWGFFFPPLLNIGRKPTLSTRWNPHQRWTWPCWQVCRRPHSAPCIQRCLITCANHTCAGRGWGSSPVAAFGSGAPPGAKHRGHISPGRGGNWDLPSLALCLG